MKLYIFRCRTRPRMFGATRYETASNLPTHNCSGWEFYERVDLSARGRLRYAVDSATVRRFIQQRGWHVWDDSRDLEFIPVRAERSTELEDIARMQTSWKSLQEEAPSDKPVPGEPCRTPTESSSPPMTASPEYLPPEEPVKNTVLREPPPAEERRAVAPDKAPDSSPQKVSESVPPPREYQRPIVKPETLESDGSLESWRNKTSESTPLRRDQRRLAFEPKARPPEELPNYSRKNAVESTNVPHEDRRGPGETRIAASGPASPPAPAPPRKVIPSPPMDVPPRRSAPVVKPDRVEIVQSASKVSVRHQVTWFDIPARDIDRAVRFYSAVLGMPIKKEQAGPGAAIAVLPHADGSVGGSLVQNLDAKPSEGGPLLYLNTHGRLDEALKEVEKNGGRVLAEKHSIAPFGFRAIVLDSEGNRIALHSR